MKQKEKLDLILKGLYEERNKISQSSIRELCQKYNIQIESFQEFERLTRRLIDDGLIEAMRMMDDCRARINSYGIEYCEENSYSYEGSSLIMNNYSYNLSNCQNTAIVNNSKNVEIDQNFNIINQTIEEIREIVTKDNLIDPNLSSQILDCLNEIQELLKHNYKPKYSIRELINLGAGIASISSLIITLSEFIK